MVTKGGRINEIAGADSELPDLFGDICPTFPESKQMIQVREVKDLYYWRDAVPNHAICGKEI